MATYLDKILDAHRRAAGDDPRKLDTLVEQARSMPSTRGFRDALRAAATDGSPRLAVIAEVKRRSPSKGDLFAELDAGELARTYQASGASCLSVLTDRDFFGGSVEDLRNARDSVEIPVLRKDFTVDPRDLCDARIMGADCVLLIVAALDDHELRDWSALAGELELDVLVEVHDEAELERALGHSSPNLIGVNQRDLVTFEVDTDRAVRVAESIPRSVVRVAESGVTGPHDATRLASAGYDAVLVGEHLVTSGDVTAAVDALRVPLP